MSLSSIIVEREIASIREVEEALARQVLYGGDLVTNLLEVCKADEAALISAAADAFGLPAGPPGELPIVPPDARRLVTADIAQERAIAPIGIDAYGLVIAVAEPLPREVEDELAFALAVPIAQRIAPLVRIRQALARDYGLPMDRRISRVLVRLGGGTMSMAPRPPAQPAALPRPPSAPPVVSMPPPGRPDTSLGTLLRVSNIPPPPGSRRRRGPLTLDVAERELEEATARDAIFDVVFEFAKQFFDYTAIFVVHGEIAEGRDAFGNGTAREKVARIGVPLDMPGLLATAFTSARTNRAVPDPIGIDRVLIADLGRTGDGECVVIPVVVRARVVALVLGDGGAAGVDADGVTQIERVMVRAAAAFERLILRKKLQGSKQPPDASRPPSVSPREGEDKTAAGDLPPAIRAMLQAPLMPTIEARPEAAQPRETLRRRTTSDVPPPEAVFAVRRPSGPPIPREEPESSPNIPAAPVMAKRRKSSTTFRAVAPTFDFSGKAGGDEALTPIAPPVIDASEAPTPAAPPVEEGVLPAPPPPLQAAPPPLEAAPPRRRTTKQMPASEQQISVAPHKPPSSRDVGAILPSIIVDVSTEYGALVQRVLASSDDDEAETELLRGGEGAMPALMAQFPGPITVDRARLEQLPLPRVAECGPILRVIAQQRRAAVAPVLARLEDANPETRFWATLLLTELTYPDAIEPLVPRVFDEDAKVRRAAKAAARAYAEAFPGPVVTRLAAIAGDEDLDANRRVTAIEALGETRETLAVPKLVELVDADAKQVASAARVALALITRRDYGDDKAAWRRFWSENQERHRIEWLIDALVDDDQPMRAAAGEELKAVTKEYFGYYEDLPKRERERVRARYEKWWNEVGRVRFARQTRG